MALSRNAVRPPGILAAAYGLRLSFVGLIVAEALRARAAAPATNCCAAGVLGERGVLGGGLVVIYG